MLKKANKICTFQKREKIQRKNIEKKREKMIEEKFDVHLKFHDPRTTSIKGFPILEKHQFILRRVKTMCLNSLNPLNLSGSTK